MQILKISVKGIAPLLMHSDKTANPLNEFTKKLKAVTSKRKKTDEDHADIAKIEWTASLYWDGKQYYLPASLIEATMLNSAKMFKLGTLLKQCVLCNDNASFEFKHSNLEPEKLWLQSEYQDFRTVKVQQAKNLRCRPIFQEWVSKFSLYLDENKMNAEQLKQVINNAGMYVGFGDYRPKFGRFEISNIEVINVRN